MIKNTDHFEVLRKIQKNPEASQRELAKKLGFSLGKLNYCISALKRRGLVKVKNFNRNPKKINYLYSLTPKGISQKSLYAINFLKQKMREYDELKMEIDQDNNEFK